MASEDVNFLCEPFNLGFKNEDLLVFEADLVLVFYALETLCHEAYVLAARLNVINLTALVGLLQRL
jgi:hypothetical protein